MYHDTIQINFKHYGALNFDYNFFISKNKQDKFSPICYNELLQKFDKIGFNSKYLKFNDIDDDYTILYCSYNWQPNFDIFFKAYEKIIKETHFNLSFSYGVVINGKFYINSMNGAAGIYFVDTINNLGSGVYREEVVKGKTHQKSMEIYQLVDKDGMTIHGEIAKAENDFEQHFFENYDVKVACRKYKLGRLKRLSFT